MGLIETSANTFFSCNSLISISSNTGPNIPVIFHISVISFGKVPVQPNLYGILTCLTNFDNSEPFLHT